MSNDLLDRLFRFAIAVFKLLRSLPGGIEMNVIKYQLAKASSSSGSNYEESQAAISRAEFNVKVGIALKEMRESNYWLRILSALFPENELIEKLVTESYELKLIPGKIVYKTNKSSN